VKLTRVLAASGLAAVLLPVPASPAAADSEGLDLVVPFVAPMLPGQQGWVGAISTTAVALTRGGDGDGGAKPAPSEAADRRTEDAFIGATAAHLCNVQLTVYDDPKALADAYGSTTAYPGISGEQVAALRKRLTTDSEFGARLAKQLATTCHPPTAR